MTAENKDTKTFFENMTEAQTERLETLMNECEAAEKKASDKVEKSIDEMANLWKSSFNYMLELNEETRSMWMESTRQAMSWMSRTNG